MTFDQDHYQDEIKGVDSPRLVPLPLERDTQSIPEGTN